MIQALTAGAYAAEIALSFDDAPQPGGWSLTGTERTERFIKVLREKGVPPVVFYANPRGEQEENLSRLLKYGEAGHVIANHTNDHPDLGAVSGKEFVQSIATADAALTPIPNYKKWFRYPYLNEGQDAEQKRYFVKNYLKQNGYRSGYITIETFDWYIDDHINTETKQGNPVDKSHWIQFYIAMIVELVEFYDNLALEVLGRSPVHVILLHENDVNALSLPELIDQIRLSGHTLVSADRAYEDPIADTKWDQHRFSQRRLMAIAVESQYEGQVSSRWIDTDYIDQRLREAGLLCQENYFFCSFSSWLCEKIC
ncbi:MAG: polysaccharide deacetylase family protein [Myxococcota bacterium]|nr:polysaccharide deacetylase family protein [Myxococcota bacterium]